MSLPAKVSDPATLNAWFRPTTTLSPGATVTDAPLSTVNPLGKTYRGAIDPMLFRASDSPEVISSPKMFTSWKRKLSLPVPLGAAAR